jgi:rhamnosyltransferase
MLKISKTKYISVFVPTFNGSNYLLDLIKSVLSQNMPNGYKLDFIITDSGSTDGTLDIINRYKNNICLNKIANSEFSHGGTRQNAAKQAKGEFIIFLSQDAVPCNERWLINMIEPFFISEKIGCVFGRQIPRPMSPPTIKREVSSVFGQFGPEDAIMLHRNKSLVDDRSITPSNTFFSDVNSAVRKNAVLKVPFRNIKYAEDQALAKDMIDAGYIKAYTAQGSVWHSHDYTISEYYKRKFDEFIGLQNSTDYIIKRPLHELIFGWIRPTIADWKFIRHDRDYSKKNKILYFFTSIGYNIASKLGMYQAAKHVNDEKFQKRHSLEESRK